MALNKQTLKKVLKEHGHNPVVLTFLYNVNASHITFSEYAKCFHYRDPETLKVRKVDGLVPWLKRVFYPEYNYESIKTNQLRDFLRASFHIYT